MKKMLLLLTIFLIYGTTTYSQKSKHIKTPLNDIINLKVMVSCMSYNFRTDFDELYFYDSTFIKTISHGFSVSDTTNEYANRMFAYYFNQSDLDTTKLHFIGFEEQFFDSSDGIYYSLVDYYKTFGYAYTIEYLGNNSYQDLKNQITSFYDQDSDYIIHIIRDYRLISLNVIKREIYEKVNGKKINFNEWYK